MKIFEKIGFRLILVVLSIILICSIALQVSSFFNMFDLVKASATERAYLTEAYIESHIDFEVLNSFINEEYEKAEQTQQYLQIKDIICNLKESSGAKFVYISMKSPSNEWIYMVDAYYAGDDLYTPLGTPIEEDYLSIYKEIEENAEPFPGEYENGEFGRLFSNYFPVLNEDGILMAVIGTDFDITLEYNKFISNFVQGILISLFFIVLSIAILWVYVHKKINIPINKIIDVTKRMEDGDLDVKIDIKSKDEIGILATMFQNMAFRINRIMTTIHSASVEVDSGSKKVLGSSSSLSQGVAHQLDYLERLTSSIEGIETQSKKNAQHADESNEKAMAAFHYAQTGNEQMLQMLASMSNITDSSKEISRVIKIIDDIAFQTNVLALNAAIESDVLVNMGRALQLWRRK